MLKQGAAPIQRVKIWSIGFTALFVLLAFLAVVFPIHLSNWTLRFFFASFDADSHRIDYQVCAKSVPESLACGNLQGTIFIPPESIPADAFFLSLYAMGLLALICLAGLFMTESKLMRFGVFPSQLFSVIIAGLFVATGTPLITNPVVYEAERIIRPLSFIMLGLNYLSLLLLSYRIKPWKKRWWSLFGVLPVLASIVSPVLLLLFRSSGWKWRPEALPLLILGEAGFFLIFGFSVHGELSASSFIFAYIFLSLAFLLIVRTEQVMKRELW